MINQTSFYTFTLQNVEWFSHTLTLAASVTNDHSTQNMKTIDLTRNALVGQTNVKTSGKPTHLPDPSVYLIFPTALLLIQFLASPHWHIGFCPDTQSQRFGKIQRANFANPLDRVSETNRIFAEQ